MVVENSRSLWKIHDVTRSFYWKHVEVARLYWNVLDVGSGSHYCVYIETRRVFGAKPVTPWLVRCGYIRSSAGLLVVRM